MRLKEGDIVIYESNGEHLVGYIANKESSRIEIRHPTRIPRVVYRESIKHKLTGSFSQSLKIWNEWEKEAEDVVLALAL